jgi:hypothetical protein
MHTDGIYSSSNGTKAKSESYLDAMKESLDIDSN